MANKILEGLWDCPYCGTKGIGGLTKHCPNCGHPQDEGTKFYLGEQKSYLDENKAGSYGKGADWTCSFCGSLNRYDAVQCKNCGASKEDSSGSYFDNQSRQAEKQAPAEEKPAGAGISFKKFLLVLAGILAVLAAVIGIINMPRKYASVISAKEWSREIQTEAYVTVHEKDWEVPEGGRVTSEAQEIHHYDQVLDHYETVAVEKTREVLDGYDTYTDYEDNGDGTFSETTRSEPRYTTEWYTEYEQRPVYRDVAVYQTMYYYDIERWVYNRSVTTSGSDDEPYWGTVELQSNERQGETIEVYTLYINAEKGNRSWQVSVSQPVWETYKAGDSVKVTVKSGNVTALDGTDIR